MLSFTSRAYGLQSDSAECADVVLWLVWLSVCGPRYMALWGQCTPPSGTNHVVRFLHADVTSPSFHRETQVTQFDNLPVCATYRHTDHATCDICGNRPHLIYAMQAMRPKKRKSCRQMAIIRCKHLNIQDSWRLTTIVCEIIVLVCDSDRQLL